MEMGSRHVALVENTQETQYFVYHHTHWDREWYQPFRQYQIRLAEVVDAILDRLEQGTLSCFTLDGQTILLDDYLALRPANRSRLEALIHAGTLNVGPWYVMPDEFLVSGESLIRNLKRGIEEARAWGCHTFTGYLPDTFGHSAEIPMILQGVGISSTMVWRGIAPSHSGFLWGSRDGSSVLAYHLQDGYFQNMLHDPKATATEQAELLQGLLEKVKRSANSGPVLVPMGGDHLGPLTQAGAERLKDLLPQAIETTVPHFMALLEGDADAVAQWPRYEGELRENEGAFLLPGVYSSRMYLKQANRSLEHHLTRWTEPLVAMAQLAHPESFYPQHELRLAWELLLQNHPHDSICGCSVDAVHRENEVRFDSVAQISEALDHRQRATLLQDRGDSEHWVIWNMGDRPYTGVVPIRETITDEDPTPIPQATSEASILVEDYWTDIQDVPLAHRTMRERHGWIWVEEVSPHGLGTVPKAIATDLPQRVTPVSVFHKDGRPGLQNGCVVLNVSAEGTLSVTDLQSGQTYAGLHRLRDRADQGDSYNSAPVPQAPTYEARCASVTEGLTGPLKATLVLEYVFDALGLTVETTVTLDAESPRVTFESRFTNTLPDHKLQVVFPTGSPVREVAAESHFGVEVRAYDPDYTEAQAMPAPAWKELKANTGPIQRFLMANGHYWVTEGLCEYEVQGDLVQLTLLRAFGYLSKGDTGVRGAQAGPPFETPEGQCLGRAMTCRYAWRPVPQTVADAYWEADCFYGVVRGEPGRGKASSTPQGKQAKPEGYSFIHWKNPAIVSTAMAWDETHGGLMVRLVNTTGEQQSATVETRFAEQARSETNFLNESQSVLETPTVEFSPFAVKTVLFQVQ
jgi:hypothetical protein